MLPCYVWKIYSPNLLLLLGQCLQDHYSVIAITMAPCMIIHGHSGCVEQYQSEQFSRMELCSIMYIEHTSYSLKYPSEYSTGYSERGMCRAANRARGAAECSIMPRDTTG